MWEEMEAIAGEAMVLSTVARAQQCGLYSQVLLA